MIICWVLLWFYTVVWSLLVGHWSLVVYTVNVLAYGPLLQDTEGTMCSLLICHVSPYHSSVTVLWIPPSLLLLIDSCLVWPSCAQALSKLKSISNHRYCDSFHSLYHISSEVMNLNYCHVSYLAVHQFILFLVIPVQVGGIPPSVCLWGCVCLLLGVTLPTQPLLLPLF